MKEVLQMVGNWLLRRLRERSTYVGLAAVASAAGIEVSTDQVDTVATAALGLFGVLNMFVPDGKQQ